MIRQIKRMPVCSVRYVSKRYAETAAMSAADFSNCSEDLIAESTSEMTGVITLNRPTALNAVSLQMVKCLHPVLKQWEREKSVIIIRGAGDDAFSVGGDLKSIAEYLKEGHHRQAFEFWRRVFTICAHISTYRKPIVSLINGLTMGGGLGLAIHGRYRVATEKTVVAMPETAIGFFPDVGSSYYLPRLKGKLGVYMGLTGQRLKGSDVLRAGIATHYCDSANLNELQADLVKCANDFEVVKCLLRYNSIMGDVGKPFSLEPHMDKINNCFSAPTVEEIVSRLEKDGSEWARNTLKVLRKMSPTSLKLTLKQLQRGAEMKSLAKCLEMEYTMAVHALISPDFREGVRALMIDKDRKPRWTPNQIEIVTEEHVERFFRRLPLDEELRIQRARL